MSIASEITRINTNIANAYTKASLKGATMPQSRNSANLASTIESIPSGGSDEWQPESDWWDIDSIITNDTEDYAGKFICLLADSEKVTTISGWGADKIKTSDGVEYTTGTSTTISHSWDITKDKACSLGYKTRYIIFYFSNSTISRTRTYVQIPLATLYCIFKNMNITITDETWNEGIFPNSHLLLCVKCINTTFDRLPAFRGCVSLIELKNMQFNGSSREGVFRECRSLQKVDFGNTSITSLNRFCRETWGIKYVNINTANVTNFNETFNSSGIQVIESLNMDKATSASNFITTSYALISINSVSNIKITGLNFSSCSKINHDTLIRILNALYDYSEATSSHTITLGSTNLAKLTEDEIAIGTDKGWTIS